MSGTEASNDLQIVDPMRDNGVDHAGIENEEAAAEQLTALDPNADDATSTESLSPLGLPADEEAAAEQLTALDPNADDATSTESLSPLGLPADEEAAAEHHNGLGQIADVQLASIRTDDETQVRVKLNVEVIQDYKELWGDKNVHFPPVVIFYDGNEFWLADGFHRVAAANLAGKSTITARIHRGSKRDAILYACGANAGYGLRRTNKDKRKAVMILLDDKEWQIYSDQQIAKICAVSQPFVSNIRKEIGALLDTRIDINGREMDTTGITKANRQRRHSSEVLEQEIRRWLETDDAKNYPNIEKLLFKWLGSS